MKRTLGSTLAAIVLTITTLTIPAQAYTMESDGFTITPNQETLDFWTQYKYPLNDQGIYEHSADNWNFCPEFHDGLLLIQDTVSPTEEYATWDNYVDKNGTLHDLNQGRYWIMSSFSGGLASVGRNSEKSNSVFNVGYIDTKGNEVIPCNEDWCRFQYGTLPFVTGRFENGKAVVLRQPDVPFFGFGVDGIRDTTSYNTSLPDRWYGMEYAYIDTQGNYLTDWVLTQDINTLINLPLYDQDGIRLSDRVYWGSGGSQEPTENPDPPAVEATYGQSTVKIKGYTIDEDYVGKMLIEVTNNGSAPDKGDLFYVAYSKFIEGSEIIDAGVYVPNDLILQIQYEVDANSTKTLEVPMGFLPGDNNLTEDQMEHGWSQAENIESSRTVLAQAETPEEAAELTAFFKAAHDYGEMALTYAPDSNGVTILAEPMSTIRRAQYLDQKLAAFTSQF
ncbi:WG repeat-containing protein [uncultured Flavonifractor sp.]|uniref:CARDB domain-containing protein n=1 Tax=Candidatus Flavonifractor intestinigallinarum TaxID=2838586 RepID=A0A9D2MMG6_9FIRM|nr:hypothetical protein [uncultured Flavonifractor sp.]HJB81116.1 hypothetical protein [Candidatus Flavonifractor intestinigallinarum]